MARVTLGNIRKAFGEVAVLHDARVGVSDDDPLVFVGPSGCGNTRLSVAMQ